MRLWMAAAIITVAIAGDGAAFAARAGYDLARPTASKSMSTDFGARRRHRVQVARPRLSSYYRAHAYDARPYYYVPVRGLTPFFPFGLGYGLDPSW